VSSVHPCRTCTSVRAVIDPVRAEREQRLHELVQLVIEPVRRYLLRRTDAATADDVLGEVLLVCWRRLDEVPGEPPEAALPWAIVVARNALANAERSARRQRRVAGKIIALDPPREVATDSETESDDSARLRDALTTLRPADAELLRLWAWEELTTPQLAAVLGITPNTAAARLMRAKARLRRALEAQHPPAASAQLSSARPTGHDETEGGTTDAR